MTNKTSLSFRIISILALVWNLLGIALFTMEMLMSEDALAAMPEAERQLIENTPSWAYVLYAVAVFGGTFGSILLILKKASAEVVLLVSFIAIVLQMSYWIFMTPMLEVYGPTGLIMPLTVIIIGALLWWYARRCKASGILA